MPTTEIHLCEPGTHKFEPRFDEHPDENAAFFGRQGIPMVKTYVRDVCVKCGATIERK